MRFLPIHRMDDLEGLIRYTGLLPFFTCSIPGFSIEENCAPEIWFSDAVPGPWDWKGPIARKGEIFYGKFAENKAVFVHRDWFPALCNYRRNGYDFDTRYELGMANRKAQALMKPFSDADSLLSPELRTRSGLGKQHFDVTATELQMQTYLCIKDFEQRISKRGEPYGWAVARYTTPEMILSTDAMDAAYLEAPEDSFRRITDHLCGILPDVPRAQIENWLK